MNEFIALGLIGIVMLLTYFVAMIVLMKPYTGLSWYALAKQIMWQRSGGYWLFYCTFIYFWIAMYSVFVEPVARLEYIQLVWIFICSLPLWILPLAKFLNVKVLWK